jgi:RNA polymerase sigma factor (sigma-70 family)
MGPELLASLVSEHAGSLTLFARQWCRVPEDVVQEAFIKLAGLGIVPERPVPWLYRAVRNGAISALRSSRRRMRHEASRAAETPAWFAPGESRLDLEAVTAALTELPIDQREVIVARLWGEQTFEEIGDWMGSSSSTAHRAYLAGLSALREKRGVLCPSTTKSRKT